VYFIAIYYIFSQGGMLRQEKSGIPDVATSLTHHFHA
jgi:hypothetical protein